MKDLKRLLDKNREWAEAITASDPEFFQTLAKQQSPKFLWIGCADSRVPATQLVGMVPGEMFVHRNVANVVVRSEEHTSELQSQSNLVCRLLLEKKKKKNDRISIIRT